MNKITHETRTLKIVVLPKGEPIFANAATDSEIVDEAAGEFIKVSQHGDKNEGEIQIDPLEWPILREAINRMVKECRDRDHE
jgi:hypothetical protein